MIWPIPADDIFVGAGTSALALVTFMLVVLAARQLAASDQERLVTQRSLEVAEATLRAQHRPELIAYQMADGGERDIPLGAYGTISQTIGSVRVTSGLLTAPIGVVSMDVCNVGPGPAQITGLALLCVQRVVSTDQPLRWEPAAADRALIIVEPGGTAPIDLVMAPSPPEWFRRHSEDDASLWVEVSYRDLGGIENHMRWFELGRRRAPPHAWFVTQIQRSTPRHSSA